MYQAAAAEQQQQQQPKMMFAEPVRHHPILPKYSPKSHSAQILPQYSLTPFKVSTLVRKVLKPDPNTATSIFALVSFLERMLISTLSNM
jgi:hypothetical protein